MRQRQWRPVLFGLFSFLACVLLALPAQAFDRWQSGCNSCHDFLGTASQKPGNVWPNSIHETHQSMVSGECNVCHSNGDQKNPYLRTSDGTAVFAPISCQGCHGALYGSTYLAQGLRAHHDARTPGSCADNDFCHFSAPAPLPENTLPEYYGKAGSLITNPCNTDGSENWTSDTLGLDNDGNLAYDAADPACGVPTTPGEAGKAPNLLTVTAYNNATGNLTVTYGVPCQTLNSDIYWGNLAQVKTYTYSGSACSTGNTGTATFNPGTGSYFFLVVANDNLVSEGSYGKRSSGVERPPYVANICGKAQTLANRCDP